MEKIKNLHSLLTVVIFVLVLACLALSSWLRPADIYSGTERRPLAQKPELTMQALSAGTFMQEFDSYAADQFPMRDGFRTIKALMSVGVLQQKDNHGLYRVNGYISKLEYPMNLNRMTVSCNKMEQVYETYLKDTQAEVYLSVIPDKNCYMAQNGGYPAMNYPDAFDLVKSRTEFAQFIPIEDLMELEDFYYTDQHWRQECVPYIACRLTEAMNRKQSTELGAYSEIAFEEHVLESDFRGAYAGQMALPVKADQLHYLTWPGLDACRITSWNTGTAKEIPMYDLEKAAGRDGYEMYLGGADALIQIENPTALTQKELVVFRDSFGSSIVPLLVPMYAKVTVVDLRYMRSDLLERFIAFDHQDVLFLYSTLVLNNTISMQ